MHGDSIGYGTRGLSWLAKGVSDTDNGTLPCLPFANFCVPSTRASEQTGRGVGAYRRKAELIDSASAFNAGNAACCTGLLSQMGVNNATTNLSLWQSYQTAWWAFLRTLYTGPLPLTQTMLTPKVLPTTSNNTAFSSYPDMTPVTDARYELNTWTSAGRGSAGFPDHTIDATPAWVGPSTPADYSTRWKIPSPQFTATVHSDTAASAASINLDRAPSYGMLLAVGVGTANVETIGVVSGITGNGPYNVTFNYGNNRMTKAHNVGEQVLQISTTDGLHPGAPITLDAAVYVREAKRAGHFI